MAGEKHLRDMPTVWWQEDAHGEAVCMIDQSLLPEQVVYLTLTHEQQVAEAIKTLKVRGAPAIGITAAFAMVLACYRLLHERGEALTYAQVQEHLQTVGNLLRHTRPTPVNLQWAAERMLRRAGRPMSEQHSLPLLAQELRNEPQAIADEDFEACLNMGRNGA